MGRGRFDPSFEGIKIKFPSELQNYQPFHCEANIVISDPHTCPQAVGPEPLAQEDSGEEEDEMKERLQALRS